MKHLIGKKVKGFKFNTVDDHLNYAEDMDAYIDKIGVIVKVYEDIGAAKVVFEDDFWSYPLSLIEEHLID